MNDLAIAKYQKFDVEVIHRSKIKNAPYNPRFIDDEARKRLKKGLKTYGLVSTLVWNRRTGNLVSGHQRLSIMDELEKSEDYELSVSVVDIDLKEEMELNVQMNNQSMMGDFDVDGLAMMADEGADVNAMGFSEADIDILFGDSPLVELYEDNQAANEAKGILKDIKKDRSKMIEEKKEEDRADYYFMVICSSASEREELFTKMGVPFSEEFIYSDLLKRLSE